MFRIDQATGLITTRRVLDGESGTYNLSVLVRNQDGDSSKTDIAYVEITVLEMSNRPPKWRLPNPNNQTVEIYEVDASSVCACMCAYLHAFLWYTCMHKCT